MNTTLQQIHLNGEVIDLTEFAKEQTLVKIKDAINNIDLTGAAKPKAYYDSNTGNLTFENIELTIE